MDDAVPMAAIRKTGLVAGLVAILVLATIADVTLDRSSRYSISATGSSGSRARLVRRALPECPPA
jgi:hypothetical protein